MKNTVGFLLFTLFFSSTFTLAFDHQYKDYGEILKAVVFKKGHDNKVDYEKYKTLKLRRNRVRSSFEKLQRDEFRQFNLNQQKAFLMNAYNFFTLELVDKHYPVTRILDIGGWFISPFIKKFFVLFGKKRSLNNLEHDILRENYKDARVHFGVNCASQSCVNLPPDPLLAEKLDQQLKQQMHEFFSDRNKNYYNSKENSFHVSEIFDWFEDDFKWPPYKGLRSFLIDNMPIDQSVSKETLKKAKIKFIEYDWSLNKL